MRILSLIVAVTVTVLGLTGCGTLGELFEHEESVPLSEVPTPVLDAAKAAVKGIVLSEAEVEEEDGVLVYEIEGEVDGKEYEIEVTAEGKVLEIEEEDEEEDEDEDEDEGEGEGEE